MAWREFVQLVLMNQGQVRDNDAANNGSAKVGNVGTTDGSRYGLFAIRLPYPCVSV